MFTLENLVRNNILSLKPYSSARDEYQGTEGIFLDANENPYGIHHRYPDPHQKALKAAISSMKGIPIENIFLGNGSDEVIDLALRIFCIPGKDKVIICPPTYGMYEVMAHIHDASILHFPLTHQFQLDMDGIFRAAQKERVKMIFICSPNNPTGNNMEKLEELIRNFSGIVFLDEAYIDFSSTPSLITQLNLFPNLIISQTLSKAWGLAGARIGMAYAGEEIISLFDKTKPPYNISRNNQATALDILSQQETFEKNKATILSEKKKLMSRLAALPFVRNIYPSETNFLLVEMEDADLVYRGLLEHQIITRNRSREVANCLRITIGTPEENNILIQLLENRTL
ncbi:MAG TPA: histidinol-phosphate transaminase [Saprospiraceae bacterium]|nr:histidinol-phosphate transaminase [Saprospiraceae bacterium]